jgi:hypothetical protein
MVKPIESAPIANRQDSVATRAARIPVARLWPRLFLVLAVSFVLSGQVRLAADRHVIKVDVLRGSIVTQAAINGKIKANLIVDTGAGPALVISHRLGKEIRELASASGDVEGGHDADSKGEAEVAGSGAPLVETLQWGDMTLKSLSPMLMDLEFVTERLGVRIDGIIGAGAFSKYITTFDYQGGRIVLDDQNDRDGVVSELRRAGADVIPYDIITVDYKIMLPVRIGETGPEKLFVLDTGATKTGLFQSVFDSLGSMTEDWPRLEGVDIATVFGEHDAAVVRAPSLTLGHSEVEGVDCTVSNSPLAQALSWLAGGKEVAGLLGYSFFKRFAVTIDYDQKKVYLARYDPYTEKYPNEYNTVGVSLRLKGNRKIVGVVIPQAPADLAGVKKGDVALRIGGRKTDDMTLEECRSALEGEPGTSVELVLLRNGRELKVDLARKKLL